MERRNVPFEVIFRRFIREVQLSGILTNAKKKRFKEKEPNRRLRRESALRREARQKIKRGY
ncbi:30S ribosomal protein S21 [Candidatus Berkelbacteria bacterium]|nr:30S ribosomal protein S21 [Candidatus Berkelbacteria bacterium]MBI2588451.1 30S ribosomal protein S21 [Candidatus Berkelbacteria bacterium]MBI4029574.1 30S ribosomal protein S21 [Candidatus Berkelbacteria bacterium]